MVEDVVDLPPKLNLALFTQPDVLEERNIIVKDGRQTEDISLKRPNAPGRPRLHKTRGIDGVCQSRGVHRAGCLVRIANEIGTRVYIAAGKVRDARPGASHISSRRR